MAAYRTRHGRNSAKLGSILIAVSTLVLLLIIWLKLSVQEGAIIALAGASTIGLVMMMVALVRDRYRAPWAFWFMLAYSLILLSNPPVGSIIGLTVAVFLLRNRKAFFAGRG